MAEIAFLHSIPRDSVKSVVDGLRERGELETVRYDPSSSGGRVAVYRATPQARARGTARCRYGGRTSDAEGIIRRALEESPEQTVGKLAEAVGMGENYVRKILYRGQCFRSREACRLDKYGHIQWVKLWSVVA